MRPTHLTAIGTSLLFIAACGQAPDEPPAERAPAEPPPAQERAAPTAAQRPAPVETAPATAPTGDFQLAGDPSQGAAPYARLCASCHGPEGGGDGPAARALRPPATDFTAVEIPPERAYNAVRGGGMAVGLAPTMPAFERMLSDEEIHHVVAYILQMRDD